MNFQIFIPPKDEHDTAQMNVFLYPTSGGVEYTESNDDAAAEEEDEEYHHDNKKKQNIIREKDDDEEKEIFGDDVDRAVNSSDPVVVG